MPQSRQTIDQKERSHRCLLPILAAEKGGQGGRRGVRIVLRLFHGG
jgi:hypothetical protein